MSLLFDSLRRQRQRAVPREQADRTARADAVLATLGYRKKRAPSLARPAALLVTGLGAAVFVAWWLWPREAPRSSTRSGAVPPPVASPRAAAPAQAPVVPLPSTRPPEPSAPPAITQDTDRPGLKARASQTSVAPPRSVARGSSDARGPSAVVARGSSDPPNPPRVVAAPGSSDPGGARPSPGSETVSSAELFRLSLYHHRAGDFVAAEANYRALLSRNELDAQVHNNLGLLYRDR